MQNDNFLSNYYVFELKQSAETPTLSLTGKRRHIGLYFEVRRCAQFCYCLLGIRSLIINQKYGFRRGERE